MLFNSCQYVAFLPVAAAVLFLLPQRLQWGWLLLASASFYSAWNPAFLSLIVFVCGVTFVGARLVGNSGRRRRLVLGIAVALSLLPLAVYKYSDFLTRTMFWIGGREAPDWMMLNLILPVGISFFTFHALSYLIDVYRGDYPLERHFGIYLLFVLFFPLLLAGPIERPGNLLRQLHARLTFRPENLLAGLRFILWGFFKKVVVADALAPTVDAVYRSPGSHPGPVVLYATVLFAVQIYCDFSGYSDIAVGSARILGVDLTRNFRTPYLATSVADFWRRWHVSLSTWFRDYVYVPLGGNRHGLRRQLIAVFLTFLASGLWHGANWTFALWGGLHGAAVAFEALWSRWRGPIRGVAGWATTMVVVLLGWTMFRAADVGSGFAAWSAMATGWSRGGLAAISALPVPMPVSGLVGAALLFGLQAVGKADGPDGLAAKWPTALRWPAWVGLTFYSVWFGAYGGDAFIYFQF